MAIRKSSISGVPKGTNSADTVATFTSGTGTVTFS